MKRGRRPMVERTIADTFKDTTNRVIPERSVAERARTYDTAPRDNERADREVSEHPIDFDVDFPDYDTITLGTDIYQLTAPPPRYSERFGCKMTQYWANENLQNGRRIHDLYRQGWRMRDPRSVPPGFPISSSKWEMHDCIRVAGDMILMELPEKEYFKRKAIEVQRNKAIINDIASKHGDVYQDTATNLVGKDLSFGSFQQVQYVSNATGEARNTDFAN